MTEEAHAVPPYRPATPEQISAALSGLGFHDDGTAAQMANEILVLRHQIATLAKTFKEIQPGDDERLQWFMRAFRGICIENRVMAVAVYFQNKEDGTQELRWGGAQAVGDQLMKLLGLNNAGG